MNGVAANFSHNLITQNVGWHTVDTDALAGMMYNSAPVYFGHNLFEDNLALGHGNPYQEKYGFHHGQEPDEFVGHRPKRQVSMNGMDGKLLSKAFD